jgi:hypothetical protein
MELVYAVTALVSAVAAVVAWGAKLRWSREFSAAKDAQLAAKQAELVVLEREIATLRELTPMRVREYFLSMKEQLEEYNDRLERELGAALAALDEKEREIALLRDRGDDLLAILSGLDHARLERVASMLRRHLRDVEARHEQASKVTSDVLRQIPRLDRDLMEEMGRVLAFARLTVSEAEASRLTERSIEKELVERESRSERSLSLSRSESA